MQQSGARVADHGASARATRGSDAPLLAILVLVGLPRDLVMAPRPEP